MPGESGWSGKKVTIATVGGLLFIGTAVAYILWVYAALDRARLESETSWRTLATALDIRYRDIESSLADGEETTFVKDFRSNVDSFRTSSRRRTQQPSAATVEKMLSTEPGWRASLAPNQQQELTDALDAFNQSQLREREILESIGGRTLELVLSFANPEEFKLAESPEGGLSTN